VTEAGDDGNWVPKEEPDQIQKLESKRWTANPSGSCGYHQSRKKRSEPQGITVKAVLG
jgi:hypothetical protein